MSFVWALTLTVLSVQDGGESFEAAAVARFVDAGTLPASFEPHDATPDGGLPPRELSAPEMVMLPDGGLPPLTDGGGLPRVTEALANDAGVSAPEAMADGGTVDVAAAAKEDSEIGEDPVESPLPAAPAADGGVEEALPPPLRPPSFLTPRMRIAASQSVVGRFANNTCSTPLADSPFERVSARFSAAKASSGATPILFDAGDMLGTSAIGRLAVETDVTRLAEAVAAMGIKGRALGHRDLSGARQRLIDFTQGLDAVGVKTVLSNLQCSDEAKALCASVVTGADPPLLVDSSEGRVGFVSAISPATLRQVARKPGEGITLTAPAEAIADATRRARAMGATRVVAVYDPAIGTELEDAIEMAQSIDPSSSPDLIFVAGVSDRFRSALTAGGNTMLVATRPAEVVTVELRDAHAHAIDVPSPGTPSPVVTAFARDLNDALCGRYEGPFPGSHLVRDVDRDTAAAFVLDVMREYALGEVALINKPAISTNAPWPIRTALTPLDLLQILPFDNTMRTTSLTGAKLVAFLNSANTKNYFVRGATNEAGVWKINGRLVDLVQQYRIVTTDFVVDKLSSDFGEPPPTFEEVQGGTVRDVVTRWLTVPRDGDILVQPADPALRSRWTITYRLQLDVTNVSVTNPNTAVFTDTQLARGQSLAIVGETEFRAIGDHPNYSLESGLRLRYGVLRTIALDGTSNAGDENNVDIVTLRTLGYARRVFGEPKWYLPRPYADVYAESELTRPTTREYHHLQLLPQAGLRFELIPTFALYVGGGMTWEVFARSEQLTPPVPPAAAVLVAGWQLRPTKLVQLGVRWMEVESNLDVFARDLGGPTQVQARGRVRVFFPLFSVLSLTATYDLFLRYVRTQGDIGWNGQLGFSNDVYIGLQVALGRAFQSFAF